MNEHHHHRDEAEAEADKAQTLASSLSKLSASSRGVPSGKDFHFFNNFDDFKNPIREISNKSTSMLHAINDNAQVWRQQEGPPKAAAAAAFPEADMDDAYDWLVNVNDELLERFDVSADDFRKKEETDSSGFQLVHYGNKKKGASASASASAVKLATKTKPKVPFHIPSIRKPQEEFTILVNNSNQPFQHVWLQQQRTDDDQTTTFIHPLEKLSFMDFVDKDIGNVDPVKPPSIESTPFKLVEEVKDLKEMAAKLRGVNEFAVDLEHNQYRSFQGLTCLMQISTRTEDFVVDTLKLRIHIGPYLREVFKDPTKRKVMHGADRDIVWLQRDFGIYICNLFDTGQASKVLKLERNSLEFLLHHFCGVSANKEYQNADWRLRPLPEEMLRYAREDTHYLLYIYDLMRIKLHAMPKEAENIDSPLVEVYKRSCDVCMQLYEKELLTENSYLHIYGLHAASFDAQQLAIVAGLCEWRDVVARAEDESTGYILPNKTLLEIAKQKPDTTSKLRRLVKSKHPYVEHNLSPVLSIIRHSVQNAAAYEAIAEHLKASEEIKVTDGSDAFSPDALIKREAGNARRVSIDGGDTMNGNMSAILHSPQLKDESSELGCSASEVDKEGKGFPFEHSDKSGNISINSDCYSSQLVGGSLTTGQSRDAIDDTLVLGSAKVTGATVQMLKKPSRAFGALLGNSAPKRKFDTNKKEEIKLEQIRSSVNFPFHSFSGTSEQSKLVIEVPDTAVETCQPQGHAAVPAANSRSDDIIMLEDNLNVEEPIHGNLEAADEHKSDFGASASEMDDEPMSLSELSSSFQQCFESINQNGNGRKNEKSQEAGCALQLKPFDYEAARKHVTFGEDPEDGLGSEGDKGLKCRRDSGGKKKGPIKGRVQRDDDGTGEFPQGRRRQAFPATGNRSATFR
ncbi:protein RRP6-like 2 isoform X2 [Quercus robur]|uniref:protein RRP6-like 2 isoform X2 n=1 Tax=Quercus robur TaxID=38942 RepID=UPI002163A6A5|nr:protein RRP6-like 2 isoform X2 [Quercus robur]